MSVAADRAACHAVYLARRRDGAGIRKIFDGLTDDDQAEVAWLLTYCDLGSLDDAELRLRSGLAGGAPSPEIF